MQKHKFDTRTETKSSLSKQVLERQRHEHEAQRIRLPQRGPFAPVIRGIGNVSSAGVHASMLNRATNGRPSRAGQSLLRLQMQYGNRYVQRVLALAGKGAGEAEAAPEVEQSIQQARGGGHGIDSRVRGQMESAFGADFGNVRLHTDTQADTLNRELNARAFTTGQDIFFRQDAYNPGNSSGRELIAHELTHVVQQNGDKVQRKLTVGQPGDKYEQEADQVARAVMQQQEQRPVQRETDEGFVRRQIEEEEEEVQMKSEYSRVQQQVEEEEEEPVQSKVEDAWIYRQVEEEEEEEIQAKLEDERIQRQTEEEETLQAKKEEAVQGQDEAEYWVRAITKYSKDTDSDSDWVPSRVWEALKQAARRGTITSEKLPFVVTFPSENVDWGDIVFTISSFQQLQIYQEKPVNSDFYRRHGRKGRWAKHEAGAARSWNRKMWILIKAGKTPDQAKDMIKISEKNHIFYSILEAFIGAASAVYPKY